MIPVKRKQPARIQQVVMSSFRITITSVLVLGREEKLYNIVKIIG